MEAEEKVVEKEEIVEEVVETPTDEIVEEVVEEVEKPSEHKEDYGVKVQRRISKLTKENKQRLSEKDRELAERDKEISRLRSGIVEVGNKPQESDFETTGEFVEKLTEWKVLNANNERSTKRTESLTEEVKGIREETAVERQKEFFVKVDEAKERIPDLEKALVDVPATPEMLEVLFELDYAADVAYFLTTHRDRATELQGMSKMKMAAEMGKIEVGLISQMNKKTVSTATDPINPIKGDDIVEKDPSKMNTKEWMAWNEKREIAKIEKRLTGR